MTTSSNDLIKIKSATVHLASGDEFKFPLVDNKGLYSNFFKTDEDFKYNLQCLLNEEFTYALYGRKENYAYLICAWSKKEDINEVALEIISSSEDLKYLLN